MGEKYSFYVETKPGEPKVFDVVDKPNKNTVEVMSFEMDMKELKLVIDNFKWAQEQLKNLISKSKVKENTVNEEPIYGTTGPLPLPIGSTKPVIKPNVDDKKKLLVLKLKQLIRDEVKKALLYDTDRPGEIKTRTKDFQKIDIKNK